MSPKRKKGKGLGPGQGPRAWLFAPAVAVFLVANLVDWPWHLAGAGALWAAALGACLALGAERRSQAPV